MSNITSNTPYLEDWGGVGACVQYELRERGRSLCFALADDHVEFHAELISLGVGASTGMDYMYFRNPSDAEYVLALGLLCAYNRELMPADMC